MAQLMLVSNPAKRRKSSRKKSTGKRRSTAKRSASRRSSSRRKSKSLTFRSNPIRSRGLMGRVVDGQLMPAVKMAAGALAVDVGFGYLNSYLPPALSVGAVRHITKAVGAILLSVVASKFVNASTANEMAKGALTVVFHDAAKEVLGNTMPGVPLGFYTSGYVTAPPRLGAYRSRKSLGFYQGANNVSPFPSTVMAGARKRIGIGY